MIVPPITAPVIENESLPLPPVTVVLLNEPLTTKVSAKVLVSPDTAI